MCSIKKRCFRCNGQKRLFKTGSAYSRTDTGGLEVSCPLCNGDGSINVPANKTFLKNNKIMDSQDDEERNKAEENHREERAEKPKRRRRKAN